MYQTVLSNVTGVCVCYDKFIPKISNNVGGTDAHEQNSDLTGTASESCGPNEDSDVKCDIFSKTLDDMRLFKTLPKDIAKRHVFIKIDVEGHETQMLYGGRHFFKKLMSTKGPGIVYIQLELWNHLESEEKPIFDEFFEQQYGMTVGKHDGGDEYVWSNSRTNLESRSPSDSLSDLHQSNMTLQSNNNMILRRGNKMSVIYEKVNFP